MASRSDGRSVDELRPLSAVLGELDRADGSARFGFGATAALSSFNGPIEVRLREELPTRATLEVHHRPFEGVGATPSRALEATLTTLLPPLLNLGQHPRSLLQLVIQSLSPTKASSTTSSSSSYSFDPSPSSFNPAQRSWPPAAQSSTSALAGHSETSEPMQHVRHNSSAPSTPIPFSARAAAINSASLAILSASSVSLRAIPVAVSLALLPSRSSSFASSDSDTVVLDPSLEEETAAGARFGFGWAVGSGISTVGGKSATSGQDNERSGGMDVDMARQDDAELEMELVWVDSEGSFSRAEYDHALDMSKLAIRQILHFMREQVGQFVEKSLK